MANCGKSRGPSKLESSNLECKNLYEYLTTRPQAVLKKFYKHPTICLALFRELPELAHLYVVRLLFVDQPIPQRMVASWGHQAFSTEHIHAIKILSNLIIWSKAPMPDGSLGWILSPTFKQNLKVVLDGSKLWSLSTSLETDNKAPDVAFLDAYCYERWESLLYYMVNPKKCDKIAIDTVKNLVHSGLMEWGECDGSPVISRQGFQFVLLERQAQVWHFIVKYLDTVEERGLDLVECLAFLLQLSFGTLGKNYSTEGMSSRLLIFLQNLREIGLVYQRKRKDNRFYPTRLALNIGKTHQIGGSILEEGVPRGYIIVETNFKVYAYSNSDLQVSLLGLFTNLIFRFPNLVVGMLTRDSIRRALEGGITAQQIIGYLDRHSHSQMLQAGSDPSLPLTVMDQIKLWELDRNRLGTDN